MKETGNQNAQKTEKSRSVKIGDLWWHWPLLIIPAGVFFGLLIGHVGFGLLIVPAAAAWRKIDNIRKGRIL